MTGIQFVTDEKGRKVAVQIELPLARIKADLAKRGRLRE